MTTRCRRFAPWGIAVLTATLVLVPERGDARPPIRQAFFDSYTSAQNTVLDDVPSNTSHCGVCHLDFDGGGPRTPYGLAVEVAINSGQFGSFGAAILSVQNSDSDADGYSSLIEITDTVHFTNTPTFPGLTAGNVGSVLHVAAGDIQGHLTPSGGTDTTPPTVTVLSPNGGESFDATTVNNVTWTASDASGIAHVALYLTDDGGFTYRPVALGEANDGTYAWFVPNRPGPNTRIRVVARDNAGNYGSDDSNGTFTIVAQPAGLVPTTLRDFDLPGTQPLQGATLDDPSVTCVTCHGNYSTAVEPWHQWQGSMMGNAARDPLFFAAMAVAEQDAPSAGDLCLRCHTPGGWQEGRSTDTSGAMVNAKDRHSVQCDFCHRMVDPVYVPGVSPPEDADVLSALAEIPADYANGMFVNDPDPIRRGPYADAVAAHAFLESPVHRTSDLCGTCHDVSNPAFLATANPGEYVPNDFDAAHPDADLRNMFPVERTYSEWSRSQYATTGVYAPQFVGNKPDGIASTCQDCHMRDVTGRGAAGGPLRTDLPLHDLTGGNYFVADIIPDFFPGEVDVAALQDAKQRAIDLLAQAVTLSLDSGQDGAYPWVDVMVTNEGAHKLPSGYPEGRRAWVNIRAFDEGVSLVFESGAYDAETGVLTHDADAKIYEIKPGISQRLSSIIGLAAGPSFHFVVNDSIYADNRIPPRGFTNAAFTEIQSPPVGYAYPDGQYWDTTRYVLPGTARHVDVTVYYQTTSKEYIEFLRDANVTNSMGQDLHDAWVANGRAAPIAMATESIDLTVVGVADAGSASHRFRLSAGRPNPFHTTTSIGYSIAERGQVRIDIYDAAGRHVRTLVDEVQEAGPHGVIWNGADDAGRRAGVGMYFAEMKAGTFRALERMTLLR